MNGGFNAGHYQIDGLDRFTAEESRRDERYLEYRAAWVRYPRDQFISQFPLHIDLESTSRCNLKCEYCSRNFLQEGNGNMAFDLFRKVVDDGVANGLASIKLNRRGEPLLHKELGRLIAYAKDCGVMDVQFNTNAMLLTEARAEEIIEAGVDRIIFSIDGINAESFDTMRVGANYRKVVDNVRRFLQVKQRLNAISPQTRVQMTVSEENIEQVPEFIDTWRDLVNKIGFNLRRDPRKPMTAEAIQQARFPCNQLWQRLAVFWNGEVVMCCGDWHSRYLLGNAWTDSLRDIWHSERMQLVRAAHRERRYDDVELCRGCEYNLHRENSRLTEMLSNIRR